MVLPEAAVAEALTDTVPLTPPPLLGVMKETVVGSLLTVKLLEAVPVLALASVAVMVRVCVPLLRVLVLRMKL